jgi:hypothetical protein
MGGSGNSKLVNRLILTSLAVVALFSVVIVLGSSSTRYGVQHTVDIKSGSSSFSESFTFTVGPLSSWRNHVLEFREEYILHSSADNATNPHITVDADLKLNGAEAEGFTRYIDVFNGSFSDAQQLILPPNLLHTGENNVTLNFQIEAESLIEPASDIELVYSGYRIRTS